MEPFVQEDRVDREAHEKGVNGRGRAKEKSLARPQFVASEQSPHARDRRIGDDTIVDDDVAVLSLQGYLTHLEARVDVVVVVRHRERRAAQA